MVYYSDKESEAVRMLADRVREHDDYEYEDFTPDQIINPKLNTHSFKNSFSFMNPAGGRSRVRKLDGSRKSFCPTKSILIWVDLLVHQHRLV